MTMSIPAFIIDQQTKRIQREIEANYNLQEKTRKLIVSLRRQLEQKTSKKKGH